MLVSWRRGYLNSHPLNWHVELLTVALVLSRVLVLPNNIYYRTRTRPHALIINFFLLFSTRTLARRSTYIRLSKIFVQGPKSHVHNYFSDPQLHSAWSVSPQRWPTSFVQMGHYSCRQCLLYGCLACSGVELKLPFWAYRQWFESEVERSFHWGP